MIRKKEEYSSGISNRLAMAANDVPITAVCTNPLETFKILIGF